MLRDKHLTRSFLNKNPTHLLKTGYDEKVSLMIEQDA